MFVTDIFESNGVGRQCGSARFFNEAKATFNKCHLTKTTNYAAT